MNIFELPINEMKKVAKQIRIESKKYPKELKQEPKESFAAQALQSTIPLIEVWRSREFFLQVYQESPEVERFSICRTHVDVTNRRWRDGITWDDLQRLKRECGRGQYDAVEVFPNDLHIVNVANQRHLWVFRVPLAFVWRVPTAL